MKFIKIILTFVSLSFFTNLFAQVPPVDGAGLAIGGYDVVAYFSNKALKGNSKIVATHKKVNYYFSSKENRDAFLKNPERYLPQFDGYCAWGVAAKDSKFPINPQTFKIIDNKLYLFFNGPFNGAEFNTIVEWNKDEPALLSAAHAKWPEVKDKK